jgi:hypothetical protein
MEFFGGNLAREIGRESAWSGRFWGRRYHSAIVSNDEQSQLDRLRYVLSNGCKEGLVASPRDWPGVSATPALLDGSMALRGKWFDRTRYYRAGKRGSLRAFAEDEQVCLSVLPAWIGKGQLVYREMIQSVVEHIEQETAQMHQINGTTPAGPKWVLRQNPHRVPKDIKKSAGKKFLASFREAIAELHRAYREFLALYRSASERLKAGDFTAEFPVGCFPSRMPFVRAGP